MIQSRRDCRRVRLSIFCCLVDGVTATAALQDMIKDGRTKAKGIENGKVGVSDRKMRDWAWYSLIDRKITFVNQAK